MKKKRERDWSLSFQSRFSANGEYCHRSKGEGGKIDFQCPSLSLFLPFLIPNFPPFPLPTKRTLRDRRRKAEKAEREAGLTNFSKAHLSRLRLFPPFEKAFPATRDFPQKERERGILHFARKMINAEMPNSGLEPSFAFANIDLTACARWHQCHLL